ncbi:MAG: hypothetical protein IH590_17865, partial [Aquamicrobium sp.]|nr:hypothetical protein [Aquamicrobium sp.]
DAAEAEGRALGLEVIARGRRQDLSGFCYFDTARQAGVVLEVRTSPSLMDSEDAVKRLAGHG